MKLERRPRCSDFITIGDKADIAGISHDVADFGAALQELTRERATHDHEMGPAKTCSNFWPRWRDEKR
jgi:hypothetical protein